MNYHLRLYTYLLTKRLEHAVLKNSLVSFLSERVVSCFLVKVGAETAHCEQRHLGHIQC